MPRIKRERKEVAKAHLSKRFINDYSELTIEKSKLKDELAVTLNSIEKYNELRDRYPEQSNLLDHLHVTATEKAALFMGSIDAISNMLNGLPSRTSVC